MIIISDWENSILCLSILSRSDSKNSITRHISFRFIPKLLCFSLDLALAYDKYDKERLDIYRSFWLVVMISISSGINSPFAFSLLPPTFYVSCSLKLLSFLYSETSLKTFIASYSVFVWLIMILRATSLWVCLHTALKTQP